MRRVRDQVAGRVKQRATEIEPLLDVDRVGGVLQLQAHLLGDVHEQVVEHFEQHRVYRGASGKSLLARHAAAKGQMIEGRHFGVPAVFHHGGRILLGDDGRAAHAVTRAQVLTQQQRRLQPTPAAVHGNRFTHNATGAQIAPPLQFMAGFVRRVACHHGFD